MCLLPFSCTGMCPIHCLRPVYITGRTTDSSLVLQYELNGASQQAVWRSGHQHCSGTAASTVEDSSGQTLNSRLTGAPDQYPGWAVGALSRTTVSMGNTLWMELWEFSLHAFGSRRSMRAEICVLCVVCARLHALNRKWECWGWIINFYETYMYYI